MSIFKRKKTLLAAGGSVLAVGGGVFLLGAVSPPQDPGVGLPLIGGGVALAHVGALGVGNGPAVKASDGDWLFESDQVRLVVGGDGSGAERELRKGAIIDLAVRDFAEDQLVEMRPVVDVGGHDVALRAETVEPVAGSPPLLRITQRSRDGRLYLETQLMLVQGKPTVELMTRVTNFSRDTIHALSLGDRARWPGALTFAPRLGFVKYTSRAQAPWIARRGRDLCYVLAFPEGPADVGFYFDRIGPTGQIAHAQAVDLAPGATHQYTRVLAVVPGGLERAAEVAWPIVGKKVGAVRGVLNPAPSWATIEALHPDHKPVLSVEADSKGRYELMLPAGNYTLLLSAPGGEDRQAVTVNVGGPPAEGKLLAPDPGSLRYTVTNDEGQPVPARLVFRGVGNTKNPSFGPIETAEGAINVVYSRSGDGNVELPVGRYRVSVTRGLEYTMDEQEVEVTAGQGATLRSELQRVVDTKGWIGADFHVHAAPSFDSNVQLPDRVVSLLAEGVEFAAATDHNHVTDYAPSLEELGLTGSLATTTGVEITTSSWGHFNAFPYPPALAPPNYLNVAPAEIFASVREMAPGAVIQVNHPRMKGCGYFNRAELDTHSGEVEETDGFSFDFDTLEVMNGLELYPETLESNISEWFDLLNLGKRFTAVGNSDSHRLIYQWAGYPRTYVRVPDDRPEAAVPEQVARSLIGGHAIVSAGPFIVALANGQAGPGDIATAERGRVTLEVSVRAPPWMDVKRAEAFLNGKRVATENARITTDPIRIEWQTPIKVDRDSWLVVIARGEKPLQAVIPGGNVKPLAFTNPILIDADGDGLYRGQRAK